ncbi:MAG: hypothetical protein ACM3QU_07555 [Verrucomicrobiota bacterium]
MRRPLTWLGLAVGALAFWRWGLRRRKAAPGQPAAGDPAEELKRKLAESRSEESATATEVEAAPAPGAPQPSLDERRRAVHDKARQAIDEMLGGEELPGEEPH